MSEQETKRQIETKIRERLKTARITREDVDRQIAEMYAALDGLATCQDVDPQDYTDTVNRAREIEAELRGRLDTQERLDRVAPQLLGACKAALAYKAEEFDGDQPVSGADLVEWFARWRQTVRIIVAATEPPPG